MSSWRDGFEAAVETAVYDPQAGPLLAKAVTVGFEISSGLTCAPNCATPWTGGPWPLPSPTTPGLSLDGFNLNGLVEGTIVGAVLGTVVRIILLEGLCCLFSNGVGNPSNVKHFRKRETSGQAQVDNSRVVDAVA